MNERMNAWNRMHSRYLSYESKVIIHHLLEPSGAFLSTYIIPAIKKDRLLLTSAWFGRKRFVPGILVPTFCWSLGWLDRQLNILEINQKIKIRTKNDFQGDCCCCCSCCGCPFCCWLLLATISEFPWAGCVSPFLSCSVAMMKYRQRKGALVTAPAPWTRKTEYIPWYVARHVLFFDQESVLCFAFGSCFVKLSSKYDPQCHSRYFFHHAPVPKFVPWYSLRPRSRLASLVNSPFVV